MSSQYNSSMALYYVSPVSKGNITEVTVHTNPGMLKYVMFLVTGIVHAWVLLTIEKRPNNKFLMITNNTMGIVGFLMWFIGYMVQYVNWQIVNASLEDLQRQYTMIMLVEIMLITNGGALFFWSTRSYVVNVLFTITSNQAKTKRILYAIYIIAPSLSMLINIPFSSPLLVIDQIFAQSYLFHLLITGTLAFSLVYNNTRDVVGNPDPWELKVPLLNDDVVVTQKGGMGTVVGNKTTTREKIRCKGVIENIAFISQSFYMFNVGFCFFAPFLLLLPFTTQYHYHPSVRDNSMIVFVCGGIVGKLVSIICVRVTPMKKTDGVDPLSIALPVLTLTQTCTFYGLYGMTSFDPLNIHALYALSFLIGLSSLNIFLTSIIRTPTPLNPTNDDNDFHPAFLENIANIFQLIHLLIGSLCLLSVVFSFTHYGSIEYGIIFLIAGVVSSIGTVASIVSAVIAHKLR